MQRWKKDSQAMKVIKMRRKRMMKTVVIILFIEGIIDSNCLEDLEVIKINMVILMMKMIIKTNLKKKFQYKILIFL